MSSRTLQDLKTPTAEGPIGQILSVAHEIALHPSDWRASHTTYVRRARANFVAMVAADPASSTALTDLIPGASKALSAGKVPSTCCVCHCSQLLGITIDPFPTSSGRKYEISSSNGYDALKTSLKIKRNEFTGEIDGYKDPFGSAL